MENLVDKFDGSSIEFLVHVQACYAGVSHSDTHVTAAKPGRAWLTTQSCHTDCAVLFITIQCPPDDSIPRDFIIYRIPCTRGDRGGSRGTRRCSRGGGGSRGTTCSPVYEARSLHDGMQRVEVGVEESGCRGGSVHQSAGGAYIYIYIYIYTLLVHTESSRLYLKRERREERKRKRERGSEEGPDILPCGCCGCVRDDVAAVTAAGLCGCSAEGGPITSAFPLTAGTPLSRTGGLVMRKGGRSP